MKKAIPWILIIAAVVVLVWSYVPKKQTRSVFISVNERYRDVIFVVAEAYRKDQGVSVRIVEEIPDAVVDSISSCAELRDKGEVKEVIPLSDSMGIAVRTDIENSAEALRFSRYLVAPEKGVPLLKAAGIDAVAGDKWAETPNLVLYSGGVNRPAVEKLLGEFSEREGVEMTSVFNGCGILCSAMQTMSDASNPRFPDAYFACDLCFVPPVAEYFSEVILLTETDIGIAVPVNNPHGIKTLTDLAKPGLKVGLCNQKQSTLGYMTAGILQSSGLDTAIRKNMAVEVPTADFLITQLRSGALDAAIVYRVNAELQKENVEFIPIKHKGARAVQPFSVRSDSDKRQLAGRLRDHFLAHPEVFEETGLKWRGDEGVMKSSEIEIPEWLQSR